MKLINLANQFLLAMPGPQDPNFSQTVTYIFSHDEEGAMGIVINRPLHMDLGEILEQMDLNTSNKLVNSMPVYNGGPVKTDRGFVIHKPDPKWQSSVRVSNHVQVTTSKDILEAIAKGLAPEKCLIALGYAGWQAGQLEQEMLENCWLNAPASAEIIYDAPYERRWEFAAAQLGFRLQDLSSQIGHA